MFCRTRSRNGTNIIFACSTWNTFPPSGSEDRTPEELAEEPQSRELILTPFADKLGVKVTYIEGTRHFQLTKDFFTVDQIVLEMEQRFKNRVFERKHFDFGDGIVFDDIPGPGRD